MATYIVYSLILIISGVLTIPTLILSKRPSSQELLGKIAPYQGWLGVVILVLGIWDLIGLLINANFYFTFNASGTWILLVAIALIMIILGFILGFNLINKYILSKNPKSEEKGQNLIAKLLPLQSIFGTASIVLGVLLLITAIF
ncbi:DUF4083 family protein [Orbus sturtevantii]|uniref:hypothetical protein n=1 Tax=Orbus sturtevantii TaxID=3074109 RepID=UPI00370DA431